MNRSLRRSHLAAWLILTPVALAILVAGVRLAAARAGALAP